MKTLFKNARIVLPDSVYSGCVEIENGKITAVTDKEGSGYESIIDLKGMYLCPGFVEIHTHGAGGADFMDGTEEAFLTACRTHLHHGTTTVFPTLLAASDSELENAVSVFERVKDRLKAEGITAPGLHMEGPYLNPEQKGAINDAYIRNPIKDEYEGLLNRHPGTIARWTVAPELEGAMEMARVLKERVIVASIGHSNAVYSQVKEAAEQGFTHVTHLYSAMSTITRRGGFRYPGVLESTFCLPQLTAEVICDGCHLPVEMVKMVHDLLGEDRICLVCDSMRCAGENVKESYLGSRESGIPVIVEDGVAKLTDRSAFAGSVATDDRLVRTAVQLAGIPLHGAVRMMTLTPARIMHIDDAKGSIEVGKDADFAVLDEALAVRAVYADGRPVWNS